MGVVLTDAARRAARDWQRSPEHASQAQADGRIARTADDARARLAAADRLLTLSAEASDDTDDHVCGVAGWRFEFGRGRVVCLACEAARGGSRAS